MNTTINKMSRTSSILRCYYTFDVLVKYYVDSQHFKHALKV